MQRASTPAGVIVDAVDGVDQIDDVRRPTPAWWTALALLLVGFTAWAAAAARKAMAPSYEDTDAFLGHALYIAEHGGWLGTLRACFDGSFPIAERHPLYLLLLSPFARRDLDFFLDARLLNVALGAALVALVTVLATRRHGRGPGLLAGLLFALSTTSVAGSSHVTQEPLFLLFTVATGWLLTLRDPGQREETRAALQAWTLAGLSLGFAWLVKSPALLFIPAVVVAGAWRTRGRLFVRAPFWGFLLATLSVASPLLVRNLVGHGELLYEGVNSHITWLSDWSELGDEHSVLYYDQYAVMTLERNGLPGAAEYFASHDAAAVLERLVDGLGYQFGQVIPTALSPQVFFIPEPVRLAIGYALFALALLGWWWRRSTWDATFAFVLSGGFILFFAWDTMFPEPRYLAPLVPIWMVHAALAAFRIAGYRFPPRKLTKVVTAGVSAAMLGVMAWTLATASSTWRLPPAAATQSYLRLVDWMNTATAPGDRISLDASGDFHGLIWLVHEPVFILQLASADNWPAFDRYLRARSADYLVKVANGPRDYRLYPALERRYQGFFRTEPDGSLRQTAPLPGWRVAYADPGTPSRFIVFAPELPVAARAKVTAPPRGN